MNDCWGAIIDDLDVVLLGINGGESRPISNLPLLAHHFWLVVLQITTHSGCVTLGSDKIRRTELGEIYVTSTLRP
jgi:hypothetical protein